MKKPPHWRFGTEKKDGKLKDHVKPGKSDVFIYYSGHGALDPETKDGYFVPVDCDPAYVDVNGYSLDLFYKKINSLEANAKEITTDIDRTATSVEQTLSQGNSIMVENRRNLLLLLQNMNETSRNLKSLTGDLKRNPGKLVRKSDEIPPAPDQVTTPGKSNVRMNRLDKVSDNWTMMIKNCLPNLMGVMVAMIFFGCANVPAPIDSHFNKGVEHYDNQEHAKAIEQYKLALRQNPKNTFALYNLAVVYQDQGKNDQAENLYLDVLKITEDTFSRINLAGIHYDKGNQNEAFQHLAIAAETAGATLRGFGLDANETGRVTDIMAKSFSMSALDMSKFSDNVYWYIFSSLVDTTNIFSPSLLNTRPWGSEVCPPTVKKSTYVAAAPKP